MHVLVLYFERPFWPTARPNGPKKRPFGALEEIRPTVIVSCRANLEEFVAKM